MQVFLPSEIEINVLYLSMFTKLGFDSHQFFNIYNLFPKTICNYYYLFKNEFKTDKLFNQLIARKIQAEIKNNNKSKTFWDFYKYFNWAIVIHPFNILNFEELENFIDYIDFDALLKHQQVEENFIVKYIDKMDFRILAMYQQLSIPFLKVYSFYLDWVVLSEFQKWTIETIVPFQHQLDWNYLSTNQYLTPDIIVYFKDVLNWVTLCQSLNVFDLLNESQIQLCFDDIDWLNSIMYHNITTETFLKYHKEFELHNYITNSYCLNEFELVQIINTLGIDNIKDIDWDAMACYLVLSEDFIDYFFDYLNKSYISQHQMLSEGFIRIHRNELDWVWLSMYQSDWSLDFLKEFKQFINWQTIQHNPCQTNLNKINNFVF